jgi:hypothetical protein
MGKERVMTGVLPNLASPTLRKSLFFLLFCCGCFSMALGCFKALRLGAADFQWEGAYLLAHHVDPWDLQLGTFHVAHLSPPNYLHELYIFFLPLTLLSFRSALISWCVLNICLSIVIVVCLSKMYDLPRVTSAVLLFCLWSSLPFRTTLQNGQLSLIELAAFCGIYLSRSTLSKGFFLGISYAKYSFSPVLFCFFLFRKRISLLIVSLALPAIGFLIAWHMLKTAAPLRLAVEPFLVSRLRVSPGYGDVMSLIDRLLEGESREPAITKSSYVVALTGSVLYAFRLAKQQFSEKAEMPLIIIASLLLFRHVVYDYVFLIVPFAYAMNSRNRAKHVIYVLIFLLWYGWRIGGWATHVLMPLPIQLINVVMMGGSLFVLDRCARQESPERPLVKHSEEVVMSGAREA